MVSRLSDEINAFHDSIKARALLIMIEWAGSARQLSAKVGMAPCTGVKWMQRGYIPPLVAVVLETLPGAPLKASEMCPDVDTGAYKTRYQCHRCQAHINPPQCKTGFRSLLKASRKASRKDAATKSKTRRPPPARPL